MDTVNAKGRVVWIHGSATPLVDESLSAQIAAVKAFIEPERMNASGYEASEANAQQAFVDVQMPPFGAPLRLVVIKGFEAADAALVLALERYLEAPNPSTVLLLSGTELPKSQSKPKKGGKSLEQRLAASAEVIGFDEKGLNRAQFVREQLRTRGFQIEPDAVDLLIEIVGKDLSSLRIELEKLMIVSEKPDVIGLDDVMNAASGSASLEVYALTQAIVSRDRAAALAALERLFREGESGDGMLPLVLFQMRQILRFAEGLRAGKPQAQAAQDAGVKSWNVRKLYAAAQNAPRAANAMHAFLDLAIALRSKKVSPNRQFEEMILALTK